MTRDDIHKMPRSLVEDFLTELGAKWPEGATIDGLRDQLERTLFIAEGL